MGTSAWALTGFKMKVLACFLACLALSYGAALPAQFSEDAILDMIQSFLTEPGFAEALGAQRVKRSAWDKEINLPNMGVSGGIKYIDPAFPIKGFKAELMIQDLKKLNPRLRGSPIKLKLKIDADGGAKMDDGLFEVHINYEINDSETGTLDISRAKNGKMWSSNVKLDTGANARYVKRGFNLDLKSDRESMLIGKFENSAGKKFTIDMKKSSDNKIDADILVRGMVFKVSGEWIKGKKLDITINDNNGQKMATVYATRDPKKTDIDINAFVPGVGAVGAKINVDKVKHALDVSLLMGGAPIITINGRSKYSAEKKKFGVELRVTDNLSGAGPRKSSAVLKWSGGPNMKTKFQFNPAKEFGVKDMTVTVSRDADDKSRDWNVLITRNQEELIKYNLNVAPRVGSTDYELDVKSQFDLSENSKLYPIFCTYGCWTKRNLEATARLDKNKPYKMILSLVLLKDGENVMNIDVNTKNNPYEFIIKAPRLLPRILPSGRSSIEFKADHNPGKKLAITSNTNSLPSLIFERLPNNDVKVILNGEEKITGGLKMQGNQISQTSTLPDGRSLTTTLKWKTKDLKHNTIDLILDGTERNLKANLDYDLSNPSSMYMNLDAKGNNKRFGDYKVDRRMTCSVGDKTLKFSSKGNSSFQNAPWPNPIQTDIELDMNYNTKKYFVKINKIAGGVAWGITLTPDGEVKVNPSVLGLIQMATQ